MGSGAWRSRAPKPSVGQFLARQVKENPEEKAVESPGDEYSGEFSGLKLSQQQRRKKNGSDLAPDN